MSSHLSASMSKDAGPKDDKIQFDFPNASSCYIFN